MNTPMIQKVRNRLKDNYRLVIALVLLGMLLTGAMALRIHMIATAMPYPNLWDEGLITNNAKKMLTEADFNPEQLYYPPFTMYLTAVGFTLGYLNAASHLDLRHTNDIGTVHYPYYTHPRVVWPAKILFTAFSVATILLFSLLAYAFFRNPLLFVFTPMILSFSTIYFYYSYNHINCDILGVFFLTLLAAVSFRYRHVDTLWQKGILPGILAGLALSSKYHLSISILFALVVILLYGKNARLIKCITAFSVMVLTFLVLNPPVLINFNHFLNHIGYIIFDYTRGRPHIHASPGLENILIALKTVLKDFGFWTVGFALLGSVVLFKKNIKDAMAVFSLPVILLGHMSSYKILPMRNILFVFPFYGFLCASGIQALFEAMRNFISKKTEHGKGFQSNAVALVFVTVTIVMIFPVKNYADWLTAKPDARNEAVQWIKTHVPKGSSIIVPHEISMDVRPLKRDYGVESVHLSKLNEEDLFVMTQKLQNPYILMPFFCYQKERHPSKHDKALLLNRFYQYIDIEKSFPGRYRIKDKWEPYQERINGAGDPFDDDQVGRYCTGCTFVDKHSIPGNVFGHSELSVGRLNIPAGDPVERKEKQKNK